MRKLERLGRQGMTSFETIAVIAAMLVMSFGAFRALDAGVMASALCIAEQVSALSRAPCAVHPARGPAPPPPDTTQENVKEIRDLLDGNWFGNVTTEQLRDITRALEQMSPDERNAVIAELTDEELRDWMDEVGGAWGGLSGEEKRRLYGALAEGLDGERLARVARAVFEEVPESEQEFIESVIAHADAGTRRELLGALTGDIEADAHDASANGTIITSFGNAETRTVAAVLVSLGRDGSEQADFDRAVTDLAAAGKLDEVLLVGAGRQVVRRGAVELSTFEPDPLLGIIEGAARSDDPDVRQQVLVAAGPALREVEFSDVWLQKAGIEDRPETPRILSALYDLLQLPPPRPEWTPPADDLPKGNYTDDAKDMLERLRRENPRVQEAADYYGIDPRAIALVAHVETAHNDSFARQRGLGRSEGFGHMHESAAAALHPEWTEAQSAAARNNAAYAPPLIAGDMAAKARAFELITGGQISIRNDPVVLAWAYNNSMATVIAHAERARQDLEQGKPVVLNLTGDEIEPHGMAGWARRDLEQGVVDDFASPHPPGASPVEHRVDTR